MVSCPSAFYPPGPVILTGMNLDYILLLSQIHRAEICYRARVHPNEPARALSADTLALLWHRTVELWKLGFV
jgi:hypothetical protein